MDALLKKHPWLTPGVSLVKWAVLACAVGLVCGLAGAAFYISTSWAQEFRTAHPRLLVLLPPAGVVIVLLYRLCGLERDGGANTVLTAVRSGQGTPFRAAPLIFAATTLTHLAGGSSGREGAALQLGGAISSALSSAVRLDKADHKVMTMCGMSAAFAAIFGTPLTAAVFAMEVVDVGAMYYAALVPCVLASLVAVGAAGLLGVPPHAYALAGVPALDGWSLLRTGALAVLFAALSILFCRLIHAAGRLASRFIPNSFLRAAAGGALLLAMTALVWLWAPGTYDYNGPGGSVIDAAVAGQARPEAFALKILFTAVTLAAGFKGGEIVPAFFTGATFGCVAAPLLGLEPSFGAALGMVGLFCGITNCPMASLLLAFELFGGQGLPLFALCAAVTYLLSGYGSLYSAQTFLFSKFAPEAMERKNSPDSQPLPPDRVE